MNLRIVWHLLKSDWRGLRGLTLAFWLSLLLAAWFPLSYSPEHFDSVPLGRLGLPGLSQRMGFPPPGEFDSPVQQWSQMAALWSLVLTNLALAGSLGFHGMSHSLARPVRKREALASRLLAILLFLILPLLTVLLAIPLVQGLGTAAAWTAVSRGAAAIAPKLCAICLFGAVSGGWWRFVGGMLALQVLGMLAPAVGLRLLVPPWISHPFNQANWNSPYPFVVMAVVGAVLLATSRHMKPLARIAIAIAAILIAPRFAPLVMPRPSPVASLYQPEPLPDWSGKVRPVLPGTVRQAKIVTRQDFMDFGFRHRLPDEGPFLELSTSWQSEGLPQGTFADWARSGKAQLVSENKVLAEAVMKDRAPGPMLESNYREYNLEVIAAALETDGKPATINRSLAASSMFGGKVPDSEIFPTVEGSQFPDTSLVSELTGIAYKFEKIVDVPLGAAVEVKVDGMPLYIRRVDRHDGAPLAGLSYVTTTSGNALSRGELYPEIFEGTPGWIPIMYLPALNEYATLYPGLRQCEPLAPGSYAHRQAYTMSWRREFQQHPEDFAGMRFILLRRVNLGRMREQFRSEPRPLVIAGAEDRSQEYASHSGEGPPSAKRPNPATATDAELNAWLRHSEMIYDHSDWKARDFAEFVPRQLPALIAYRSNWSSPPPARGDAIALACPESRRGEVIDALNRQQGGAEKNWIPKLLLSRGWVEAAAPEIRKLAAAGPVGRNQEMQTIIAMLEDPQTYPALLDVDQWTGWTGIYLQTRRLPGIEPALTKAIEANYRKVEKQGFRRPGSVQHDDTPDKFQDRLSAKFYFCLIPAAHGMPDAFSELLKTWQAFNEFEQRRHCDNIRSAMLLPGDEDDWKATVGALAAREPSDFHYDTLARMWVPVTEPKQ